MHKNFAIGTEPTYFSEQVQTVDISGFEGTADNKMNADPVQFGFVI